MEGGCLIVKYYPKVYIVNEENHDIKNLTIRTSGRVFQNRKKIKDIEIKNSAEQSRNLPGSSESNSFDWESFNARMSNLFAGMNQMHHHTFNHGNMSQTVYTPENADVRVMNIPSEVRNLHLGNNVYVGPTSGRTIPSSTRRSQQPTASSQAKADDLPPSYEATMRSGAAAAAGSPPTCSEMPREGKTRVASNLSSSTVSSPLNNSQKRR